MFEWTNCKEEDALMVFLTGFFLIFLTRQCLLVSILTLARMPIRLSIANLVILFCPIWPNLAYHLYESKLLDVERKVIYSFIYELFKSITIKLSNRKAKSYKILFKNKKTALFSNSVEN